ncbi:hypothetical protein ABW636_15895 [Aquimarina sp. 2201CG1-2-11]|uniref:hypothetical protein n=1 Tax=Aquimarina discodermiae TaxID=3231043 RepID=UPI0034630175
MEEQYKDIRDLVKEAGLECPSSDFLSNVMNKVEVSSVQAPVSYKPLISRKGWGGIIFVISLVIFLLLSFESDENSFFDKLNFLNISKRNFEAPFSGYTLHKSTIYGILLLCFLFFVQVTMLKRKIDKDFS